MNWQRTLFRIWIFFAVCWFGAWSWYYRLPSCGRLHPGESTTIGWHCDGPLLAGGDYNIVPLAVMVVVVIGIPLAVLGIGLALYWIASAARRGKPDDEI